MKKALLAVFALALLTLAGFGSAQKFGVYAGYGYDGMLGGQYYLSDDLRLSLGITPVIGLAVGGSLDFILGRVDLAEDSDQELGAYYGVGVGGGVVSVLGVAVFSVQGHGMGGVEFGVPDSDLSIFGEFGLGPAMYFTGGTGVFTLAYDVKLGVLFR